MDLKSSLERLDKSELVKGLVELAEKREDNYAYCACLISTNKDATAGTDGDEHTSAIALKGMRSDLKVRLAKTEKKAQNYCGDKTHLYDDSHCVYDVENIHKKWIVSELISSPGARLEALCELATSSMPSLEGSIYEFDGDRVLLALDRSVVETLKEIGDNVSIVSVEILHNVAEVFSDDYWKNCQDYGLFEEAPSKLKGGAAALKMSKSSTDDGLSLKKRKKRK
eukprot:CAMPEP_0194413138 /NCGR_PEP_ID=MMETSP0176-20130528/11656_1 /TAXON_ID=216777 /ORGANISM="Proboscia alata, Strain PI-D3" /LENGTH=224 /DNA_ID=CAMNT_0039216325 /DNA_START=34 /DNA_END=708 /DNA_ORIENTATION=-